MSHNDVVLLLDKLPFWNQSPEEVKCMHTLNTLAACEEYSNTIKGFTSQIAKKTSSLKEQGIKVDEESLEEAIEALRKLPVHIGERAEEANKTLLDTIDNKLFRVDYDKKVALIDTDSIESFQFPDQPYYLLDHSKDGNKSFQCDIKKPFVSENTLKL